MTDEEVEEVEEDDEDNEALPPPPPLPPCESEPVYRNSSTARDAAALG